MAIFGPLISAFGNYFNAQNQRDFELQQRNYNTPANQVMRLQQAGLNPNILSASVSNTSNAQYTPYSLGSAIGDAVTGISNGVFDLLSYKQKKILADRQYYLALKNLRVSEKNADTNLLRANSYSGRNDILNLLTGALYQGKSVENSLANALFTQNIKRSFLDNQIKSEILDYRKHQNYYYPFMQAALLDNYFARTWNIYDSSRLGWANYGNIANYRNMISALNADKFNLDKEKFGHTKLMDRENLDLKYKNLGIRKEYQELADKLAKYKIADFYIQNGFKAVDKALEFLPHMRAYKAFKRSPFAGMK